MSPVRFSIDEIIQPVDRIARVVATSSTEEAQDSVSPVTHERVALGHIVHEVLARPHQPDIAMERASTVPAQIETYNEAATGMLPDHVPTAVLRPAHPTDLPPVITRETLEAPEVTWTTELAKEPLEIYEDFTQALLAFAESPVLPMVATEDEVLPDIARVIPEFAESQSIVMTVAERLAKLDSEAKETTAPILQNIVGAVHGLQLLEAREANPEVIADVEARLEVLCASLFEAIGIDYDEEDVEQFVQVMLHPEFRLVQPAEEAKLNLENVGTREAKHHFPRASSGLAGIESQLRKVLGMVALVSTRPTEQMPISA